MARNKNASLCQKSARIEHGTPQKRGECYIFQKKMV
jgi:hypothetical protein